jgi:hypothetical protein
MEANEQPSTLESYARRNPEFLIICCLMLIVCILLLIYLLSNPAESTNVRSSFHDNKNKENYKYGLMTPPSKPIIPPQVTSFWRSLLRRQQPQPQPPTQQPPTQQPQPQQPVVEQSRPSVVSTYQPLPPRPLPSFPSMPAYRTQPSPADMPSSATPPRR